MINILAYKVLSIFGPIFFCYMHRSRITRSTGMNVCKGFWYYYQMAFHRSLVQGFGTWNTVTYIPEFSFGKTSNVYFQ